jgi:hypothetical protein
MQEHHFEGVAEIDMSWTLLRKITFYMSDQEMERIDKARGPITASRLGAIAVRRLLDDVDQGRVNLLQEKGLGSNGRGRTHKR